jgi:hypothetical protein
MADPPPFPDLKSAPWIPTNIAAAMKRLKNDRHWKWKVIINSEHILQKRQEKPWYKDLEKHFKITREEMLEHSTLSMGGDDF